MVGTGQWSKCRQLHCKIVASKKKIQKRGDHLLQIKFKEERVYLCRWRTTRPQHHPQRPTDWM